MKKVSITPEVLKVLEDFELNREEIKQIIRGRHPKATEREVELWTKNVLLRQLRKLEFRRKEMI